MSQQKKDGQPGSQFDSGFGGSMFGGGGNTQFNGQGQPTNAGPSGGGNGGNSQFGGGEFASGFGGTNAVSQIFKEGGFAGDERKKRIALFAGLAALVLCGGAVYFMFMDDSADMPVDATAEMAAPTDAASDAATDAATDGSTDAALADEGAEEAMEDEAAEGAEASAPSLPAAAAPAITGDTTTYDYNEEMGGPVVSATAGSVIEVARRADFADAYVLGSVGSSGQFRIPNPPPGAIYWRIQGTQGSNQITVNPPAGLGINFAAPASISEGTQLSWSSSGPVAYYRVEFSTDQSFSSLAHVISTSQSAVGVTGVAAGSYFVRLGGFNRASGKWEYSAGSSVTVQ